MENAQKNLLLEQILDVLGYLVRYGYYDDVADINEVMVPLIQLLDGKTDVPSPSRTGHYTFLFIYNTCAITN